MINRVIYIKRPLFSSRSKTIKQLCYIFNMTELFSRDNKCTILSNQGMIISIRKRIIDIVLLSNYTRQEKESIYREVKSALV